CVRRQPVCHQVRNYAFAERLEDVRSGRRRALQRFDSEFVASSSRARSLSSP
ncbi:MAG: hypothetical protein ACI9N0_000516, partial [Ilumatobacter sp.]